MEQAEAWIRQTTFISTHLMPSNALRETSTCSASVFPTARWGRGYRSFSFVIDADGRRIVYTGDVASLEEMDALVADGCDVLLCETGHHKPIEICALAKTRGVGRVYFLHHGRYIMQNY